MAFSETQGELDGEAGTQTRGTSEDESVDGMDLFSARAVSKILELLECRGG